MRFKRIENREIVSLGYYGGLQTALNISLPYSISTYKEINKKQLCCFYFWQFFKMCNVDFQLIFCLCLNECILVFFFNLEKNIYFMVHYYLFTDIYSISIDLYFTLFLLSHYMYIINLSSFTSSPLYFI